MRSRRPCPGRSPAALPNYPRVVLGVLLDAKRALPRARYDILRSRSVNARLPSGQLLHENIPGQSKRLAVAAIRTQRLTKHFGSSRWTCWISPCGPVRSSVSWAERSGQVDDDPPAAAPGQGHHRAWLMDVPVGDIERAHRHVAYVPGDVALWPQLTGTEALHLLGNPAGWCGSRVSRRAHQTVAAGTGAVRSYAKGNRQKAALIAAFMTRGDVLGLMSRRPGWIR